MTHAELIAEGKRLRISLVENEGPDDESTLYAFALWAVDIAERLAAALEGKTADAKFWEDRFEHLQGRMVPMEKDAPFAELFSMAELAGGYDDQDFDAQVGAKFITERYALRKALADALTPEVIREN